MANRGALGFALLAALGCGDGDDGGDLPDGAPPPSTARCEFAAPTGPVFYVATDGDDGNDGSESSPWATIETAVDSVPDGATVLVRPGTYNGEINLRGQFAGGITVRSEQPYRAVLRHSGTVVRVFTGQGITIEGFDIAHDGPGAEALVVQIQDLIEDPGGADFVSRITLRNNVLHDSYNNDILKINNGASQITVEGNVFYNQSGEDEHIDVNSVSDVTIQDNIFFNDFAASGRSNDNSTSSYIVVKDSNGADDSYMGAERIAIRRNLFLNWEGSSGTNFVLLGEDGNPYHEAFDVTIENNVMLGNSSNEVRAPFGIKGARDVVFRHNTVVGDMPSNAFAFRFNQEGDNPVNQNIQLYNNIWADPTGTMDDFSDTPVGETDPFTIDNNLYYNGGSAVPDGGDDAINPSDDASAITGDPVLPDQSGIVLPVWDPAKGSFGAGSADTCAAFERLARDYAAIGSGSAAAGAARGDQSPSHDILGADRGASPSVGAFQ